MSEYWLVTGSNRGIGLALVTQLAARENSIIFATVRNTSNLGQLASLVSQYPNVRPLQLSLEVAGNAQNMAAEIAKVTDHLDIVIANAGIAYDWVPLEKIDLEVAKEHISVNTLGTLSLFQAVLPLLRKSPSPKFVPITTEVASITSPVPYNTVSTVALSKIGVNFITQRIHVEHEKKDGIIAFPMNPGGVKTDLGNAAAPLAFGIEQFELAPEESAAGLLSVIDKATRNESGGFWSYTGKEIPW